MRGPGAFVFKKEVDGTGCAAGKGAGKNKIGEAGLQILADKAVPDRGDGREVNGLGHVRREIVAQKFGGGLGVAVKLFEDQIVGIGDGHALTLPAEGRWGQVRHPA